MGMKEFIADFKEMVKTKDISKVNERYLKPAYKKSKEAAIVTKDLIVKYTPIVVDAGKKGWDRAYDVIQKKTQKNAANTTPGATTASKEPGIPTTPPTEATPPSSSDKSDNKTE